VCKNIIGSGRGRTSIDAILIAGLLGYRPDADKDNALLQVSPPSSRVYVLHAVRYSQAVKMKFSWGWGGSSRYNVWSANTSYLTPNTGIIAEELSLWNQVVSLTFIGACRLGDAARRGGWEDGKTSLDTQSLW